MMNTYMILTIVHVSSHLVLSILVVVFNTSILVALVKKRALHTPSNAVLGCLCCSDLLIGMISSVLCSLDISIIADVESYTFEAYYKLSEVYVVFIGLSSIFIAAINLDRFASICHPYRYLQHATAKLYAITSVCTCTVYALLVTFCLVIEKFYHKAFISVTVMVIICVNILIVLFCSWRIVKVILRHRREIVSVARVNGEQQSSIQNETKRYLIVVVLVILFFVCAIPRIVGEFIVAFGTLHFSFAFIVYSGIANSLMLLNSLINPVVYFFRIKLFRNAVKELFCCQRSV